MVTNAVSLSYLHSRLYPPAPHVLGRHHRCQSLTHFQILGGIADTVAQSLTAIRQRAVRKPGGPDGNDVLAIEIHELDRKGFDQELIPDSPNLPPPFDFERLTRFMAYGFLMAPVQHKWFSFLSRAFPVTKASGTVPALKRVAFDQLIFAPCGRFPWVCRDDLQCSDNAYRSQHLLYFHDRGRRWRKEGFGEEVPGRVHAGTESELSGLAGCADSQLQSYATPVPNCTLKSCTAEVY